MKIIYNCDFLNSGLHFLANNLRFCCAPAHDGPNISAVLPGSKRVISDLMKLRQKTIEDMKNHVAHKECLGCIYLKEYDISSPDTPLNIVSMQNSKPLISHLVVDHFKQCDCSCIYCQIRKEMKTITTEPKYGDYYKLYPIIEQLYREKLLDKKNLTVEFMGGNISVLKEFPDLVKIFLKNNVKAFTFYTNGIKFLPDIVEASKKADVMLITSLDAGTRDTFKKIKNVDKFDDVVENLRKYRAECKNFEMYTKYVLMENINDNKEEIDNFLIQSLYAGTDIVQMDIDYNKFMNSKGVRNYVPKHFYELFDYFREQCELRYIKSFVWEYTQQILDRGYFE